MLPLTKSKIRRKTFVAREDLLEKLGDIAQSKGCSLYSLINEIFEIFLRAEQTGLDLRNVVETSRILESAKHAGFVLGLESLWYSMADLVYKEASEEARKSWYQAGIWFAKRYLAVEAASSRSLEDFLRYMKLFAWNISELKIEYVDKKVCLNLYGPRLPVSFMELFKSFLCGLLDSYGLKVVREEVSTGAIRLEAVDKYGKESKK